MLKTQPQFIMRVQEIPQEDEKQHDGEPASFLFPQEHVNWIVIEYDYFLPFYLPCMGVRKR